VQGPPGRGNATTARYGVVVPTTPPTRRERSLHEAALFGAAVIALLIAGTLALVLALLWLCDAPPSPGPLGCLLALLLGAGVLRLYAHFARDAT
jgi:hypothetical protein